MDYVPLGLIDWVAVVWAGRPAYIHVYPSVTACSCDVVSNNMIKVTAFTCSYASPVATLQGCY